METNTFSISAWLGRKGTLSALERIADANVSSQPRDGIRFSTFRLRVFQEQSSLDESICRQTSCGCSCQWSTVNQTGRILHTTVTADMIDIFSTRLPPSCLLPTRVTHFRLVASDIISITPRKRRQIFCAQATYYCPPNCINNEQEN